MASEFLRGLMRRPFRFLDLPPELRNHIHEHILTPTRTGSESVTIVKPRQGWTLYRTLCVLAILQTCQQIHDEAKGIFHDINPLAIDGFVLAQFTHATSSARLRAIRHLTIDIRTAGMIAHVLKSMTAGFEGLQTLHLRITEGVDYSQNLHVYYATLNRGSVRSLIEVLAEGAPRFRALTLSVGNKGVEGLDAMAVGCHEHTQTLLQQIVDRVRAKRDVDEEDGNDRSMKSVSGWE